MKYVLLNDEIKAFFNDKGIAKFNPYKLEKGIEAEFLSLLLGYDESVAGNHETIKNVPSFMQGKADNLKYLVVLIGAAILLLSVIYWTMFYLPKPY